MGSRIKAKSQRHGREAVAISEGMLKVSRRAGFCPLSISQYAAMYTKGTEVKEGKRTYLALCMCVCL